MFSGGEWFTSWYMMIVYAVLLLGLVTFIIVMCKRRRNYYLYIDYGREQPTRVIVKEGTPLLPVLNNQRFTVISHKFYNGEYIATHEYAALTKGFFHDGAYEIPVTAEEVMPKSDFTVYTKVERKTVNMPK